MRTILVSTIKGGSGKTTVAVNLAASFASTGAATILADRDRQRSSLDWLKRRPSGLAPISGLDWTKEVGDPPKSADILVIDAPAALRPKDLEELVGLADRIIVPVVPSAFDRAATERFLKRLDEIRSVAKGKKPVGVVGNRLRAGTRSADRLAAYLGGTGHLAVAQLRDSQAYVDVAESGISLFERRDRRAEPLVAEWQPLIDFARAA